VSDVTLQNALWLIGGSLAGGATAVVISYAIIRRRTINGEAQSASFQPKALFNRPEAKLYRMIEHRLPKGYRLMAQVSYGEMLKSSDLRRFHQINARRADMVIVDAGFNVVAVIEYHGVGHRGPGRSALLYSRRADLFKRQAIAEAGLLLIEIPSRFTPATVARALQPIVAARDSSSDSSSDAPSDAPSDLSADPSTDPSSKPDTPAPDTAPDAAPHTNPGDTS